MPDIQKLIANKNLPDPDTMKTKLLQFGCTAYVLLTLAVTGNQRAQAAVYNSFTYQGRLTDDFGPGWDDSPRTWDFLFKAVIPSFPCYDPDCLWTTNCPNCSTIELGTNSVIVNQGLFTTPITMPTGLLSAPFGVLLQIAVRTNGGGEFTTLSPMQRLTATPYATIAQSVSGPIPASSLVGPMPTGLLTGTFSSPLNFINPSNIFAGDGSLLTHVNAATIGGLDACNLPCYWKLTGNTGTLPGDWLSPTDLGNFLGTTDDQPVTIRVNKFPGLRVIPADPVRTDDGSAPLEPFPALPNIVGGFGGNTISADARSSTIAGGGGLYDHVFHAMTPGWNAIGPLGDFCFIGSGSANYIQGPHNSVLGGHYNHITNGNYCVIAGGEQNLITHPVDGGAIVAGFRNTVTGSTNANSPSGDWAFIGAGLDNTATNYAAFIGAGGMNVAGGAYSVVTGGSHNSALGEDSVVSGGYFNQAQAEGSVVAGGVNNWATKAGSFAAGTGATADHDGSFAWADRQGGFFYTDRPNQFAVRAQNGVMVQGTTTTLDLRGNGAIRVAGAGVGSPGPVFIHRATAASVSGHITTIDHPLANGDPNAILLVTHNYSADTSATPYETNTVGVWYNGSKWTIYHENTGVAMPVGRAFNVMIIKP